MVHTFYENGKVSGFPVELVFKPNTHTHTQIIQFQLKSISWFHRKLELSQTYRKTENSVFINNPHNRNI